MMFGTSFLAINKLDFGKLENDMHIPLVHPQFVRRIKINLERGLIEYLPLAFTAFHQSKIEELLFEGRDYFLRPIKTVLEAVDFPNLMKISLHELDQKKENLPAPQELQMSRLSAVLNSVKYLEFWPSEQEFYYDKTNKSTNRRNFPLFQRIINNCPNLEELKVFRQFIPDLRSCAHLKSLEWIGPSTKISAYNGWAIIRFHGDGFSIPSIIGMLTPVKETFENLSLGSPMDQDHEADRRQLGCFGDTDFRSRVQRGNMHRGDPLEYPSMPKLTKLFVSDVHVFGPSYNYFNRNLFPALKNLTLRSTKKYEFPIKELLLDYKYANKAEVKLEFLSLNQVPLREVWIREEISSTFPNLTELSLGLTAGPEIRDLTSEIPSNPGRLKNILTTLSRNMVNLEKLTIDIKFVCTFYGLVDAIFVNGFENNNLDSKKLRLKLVAPEPDLITDDERTLDGPPKISESILIYKSLTFQGFRIRDQTRKKMQDFVVERDLKDVYFLQ